MAIEDSGGVYSSEFDAAQLNQSSRKAPDHPESAPPEVYRFKDGASSRQRPLLSKVASGAINTPDLGNQASQEMRSRESLSDIPVEINLANATQTYCKNLDNPNN